MTLFNESAAWRETSQWKAVFATPSIDESNSQLFANFGSLTEENSASSVDTDMLVHKITDHLALEVFSALKGELQSTPRSAQTSQCTRDTKNRGRTPLPRSPPVVTPNNNKRLVNGTSQKPRFSNMFVS